MSGKRSGRAIGIFDSGLGGLTVFKSVRRLLPGENIIYFGDTARVPYGTKSEEAVISFSKEIASYLLRKNIKLLIVACNTASSVALEEVRKISGVPVLGVIEPGVKEALSLLRSKSRARGGRVLVIGTSATVSSGAYSRALFKKGGRILVSEKACPLFVPLAEEGWCSGRVAAMAAEKYLGPLRKKRFDAVILGCTHYPLLKKIISAALGPGVSIVDSAMAAAVSARAELKAGGLLRNCGRSEKGKTEFIVSDAPEKFRELALGLLKIKTGRVAVKRF